MAMVRIHKETFKRSFLYTFLLGFLAHGYGFCIFSPPMIPLRRWFRIGPTGSGNWNWDGI